MVRVAVVRFPGSNCDEDARRGAEQSGAEAYFVWHRDTSLQGADVVVLPGGFSYGDYLRSGAIARFSPIMQAVQAHAAAGGAVIGICNGFQILCEAHLLPGALMRNAGLTFVSKPVDCHGRAHRHRLHVGLRADDAGADSRWRTARAGTSPTPRRSRGSRARARSCCATSSRRPGIEGNPNGSHATTSPASATRPAPSSASCRIRSAWSIRSSARPTASSSCGSLAGVRPLAGVGR